jgi:3-mercaptopyruvate sulfurtransferase SseA
VPRRYMTTMVALAVACAAVQLAAQQQSGDSGPLVIPRVKLDDFRARHASGSILVVDVRDEFSYKVGHIPNSINVPLPAVEARASGRASGPSSRTVRAPASRRPRRPQWRSRSTA